MASSASKPSTQEVESRMAAALSSALAIPSSTRWVADWLFTDLGTHTFHKDWALSPSALQDSSLVLGSSQTMFTQPDPEYPPTVHHSPPPMELVPLYCTPNENPTAPVVVTDNENFLFVPVANLDSHTVGYCLVVSKRENLGDCMAANPFIPPFISRFVYSTASNHLLLVAYGGKPPAVGLRSLQLVNSVCRENFTVLVPASEYSWSNLPSEAFCMMSNVEYSFDKLRATAGAAFTSPTAANAAQAPTSDDHLNLRTNVLHTRSVSTSASSSLNRDTALHLIDSILSSEELATDNALPFSSHMPWSFSNAGTFSALDHAVDTSTTSKPANTIASALASISAALSGEFEAPAVRLDAMHFFTGKYSSTFTGNVVLRMDPQTADVAQTLKRRFILLHYSQMLGVVTDNRLGLCPQAPIHAALFATHCRCGESKQEELQWVHMLKDCQEKESKHRVVVVDNFLRQMGKGSKGSPESVEASAPIPDKTLRQNADADADAGDDDDISSQAHIMPEQAPQRQAPPKTVSSTSNIRCVKCGSKCQPVPRDVLLEERRKRNRLSAARSSDKKKKKLENMQSEIERGKESIVALKQQHDSLLEENVRLRSQLSTTL